MNFLFLVMFNNRKGKVCWDLQTRWNAFSVYKGKNTQKEKAPKRIQWIVVYKHHFRSWTDSSPLVWSELSSLWGWSESWVSDTECWDTPERENGDRKKKELHLLSLHVCCFQLLWSHLPFTHSERVIHLWDDMVSSVRCRVTSLSFSLHLLWADLWQANVLLIGIKVKLRLPVFVPISNATKSVAYSIT